MRYLTLWILFIPGLVLAHEIQSVTQAVGISRQRTTGWQQDLIGKFVLNRKIEVGAQGTYLERFDRYEKQAGALVNYRMNDRLLLEARYVAGNGNQILPEGQGSFGAYYSLMDGLSPYLIYRDTKYSVTHLNTGTLGVEIEKIPYVILIPQVVFGKATFDSPAGTKDVYNFGLRAVYYVENKYSLSLLGYSGKEAAQGIVGESNFRVKTLSGGAGASYHITPDLKADLTVVHTDYDELKTRFITTTLNLVWKL